MGDLPLGIAFIYKACKPGLTKAAGPLFSVTLALRNMSFGSSHHCISSQAAPAVSGTDLASSSLSAGHLIMPRLSRSHRTPTPATAILPSKAYCMLAYRRQRMSRMYGLRLPSTADDRKLCGNLVIYNWIEIVTQAGKRQSRYC